MEPDSITGHPGKNIRLFSLGVSWVWMNIDRRCERCPTAPRPGPRPRPSRPEPVEPTRPVAASRRDEKPRIDESERVVSASAPDAARAERELPSPVVAAAPSAVAAAVELSRARRARRERRSMAARVSTGDEVAARRPVLPSGCSTDRRGRGKRNRPLFSHSGPEPPRDKGNSEPRLLAPSTHRGGLSDLERVRVGARGVFGVAKASAPERPLAPSFRLVVALATKPIFARLGGSLI